MTPARGQATVELALGGLLLLSTVMLGLWLTEVSFLTIKVQEASAAAVWNATGRPLDDFTDAEDSSATQRNHARALTAVEQQLGSQYRNFDAAAGGSNGTARVFTSGKQLEVSCVATGPAGRLAFNLPPSTGYDDGTGTVPPGLNAQLRRWYQPRGAAICTASAEASAWQLPRTFADRAERGLFTRFRDDRVFRLCGAGKAVGGGCGAGYPVLLGDWALDGPPGSRIIRDSVLPQSTDVDVDEGNVPYRSMVRILFETSGQRYDANGPGPGASAKLASKLAAQRPPDSEKGHNDKKFYMSYAGSEHDYNDMLEFRRLERACLQCHFNTAGTQPANGNPRPRDPDDDWRTRRQPCFLGLGGCR